jgi:hypothetical protein
LERALKPQLRRDRVLRPDDDDHHHGSPPGTSYGAFSIDRREQQREEHVGVGRGDLNGSGSYKVNKLSITATSSAAPYKVTPLPAPGASSGSWTKNQSNIPFTPGVTYSSNTIG